METKRIVIIILESILFITVMYAALYILSDHGKVSFPKLIPAYAMILGGVYSVLKIWNHGN